MLVRLHPILTVSQNVRKYSIAIIREPYKLTQYFGYEGVEDAYELYHLENDPEELDDRLKVEPGIADELKEALTRKIEQVNQPYKKMR